MKKIMVVDTSQTIKNVVKSLLTQRGYNVVCTSDGLQAWEFVNSDKPDLILAGTELSGMSGLELCTQISDRAVSGDIPVIMLLGANDKYTKEELISAGARGRLMKPFSPNDLIRVVEKLIGKPETQNKSEETKLSIEVEKPNKDTAYNLNWDDVKDIDKANSSDYRKSQEIKEPSFEPAPEDERKSSSVNINNAANESDGFANESDINWNPDDSDKKIPEFEIDDDLSIDNENSDLDDSPESVDENQV